MSLYFDTKFVGIGLYMTKFKKIEQRQLPNEKWQMLPFISIQIFVAIIFCVE